MQRMRPHPTPPPTGCGGPPPGPTYYWCTDGSNENFKTKLVGVDWNLPTASHWPDELKRCVKIPTLKTKQKSRRSRLFLVLWLWRETPTNRRRPLSGPPRALRCTPPFKILATGLPCNVLTWMTLFFTCLGVILSHWFLPFTAGPTYRRRLSKDEDGLWVWSYWLYSSGKFFQTSLLLRTFRTFINKKRCE